MEPFVPLAPLSFPGPSRSDRDVELWRKWNTSRNPADLETLMTQVMPVLRREVDQGVRVVPRFMLENEAKRLALKAFESYDPNRGVQISTHLINNLQKLKRTIYAQQSIVGVPEHHRITYNTYQRTRTQLEDELGHPPTLDHVADRMALSPQRLKTIVRNVEKRELMESGEGPVFQKSTDDDVIHLAYNDLTARQKKIFEHRTGYGGALILPGAQIMKKLDLTQGQLSYEVNKIKDTLVKAQKLR